MQDIDKISKELILPSLSMTKSSSFTPVFHQQPGVSSNSAMDHSNPLKAAGGKVMDDNPYSAAS
jgi:hypothetical protein